MSFSKTPGLRVTEVNLDSRKQLMEQKGRTGFKLVPLFKGQTLEIANAILEFEHFDLRGRLDQVRLTVGTFPNGAK